MEDDSMESGNVVPVYTAVCRYTLSNTLAQRGGATGVETSVKDPW